MNLLNILSNNRFWLFNLKIRIDLLLKKSKESISPSPKPLYLIHLQRRSRPNTSRTKIIFENKWRMQMPRNQLNVWIIQKLFRKCNILKWKTRKISWELLFIGIIVVNNCQFFLLLDISVQKLIDLSWENFIFILWLQKSLSQ